MLISLKWIKKFIDLPLDNPKKLGQDFTIQVAEVEDVILQKELYNNIIVTRVISIEKFTEKLFKTVLSDGQKTYNVITGARNVAKDDLVPLAKTGAVIPENGKEIGIAEFKGEKSEGMLCSAAELRYYNDVSGILLLNKEKQLSDSPFLKPGSSIADLLEMNDIILEIDNKSLTNRPDLWGHYGIAREFAAIYSLPLKPLCIDNSPLKSDDAIKISVEDKKACPAYAVIHIENIQNTRSPLWIQKQLYTIGQRPISLLVDLTNLIMFEVGEPLHAFDEKKINSPSEIGVRFSRKGEIVKTLDEKERGLPDNTLLITDHKDKPVAIAGIMGLQNSEVSDDTCSIYLEIANFDQAIVRKASVNLKLRTDASMRFEKSLDPHYLESCYHRFTEILSGIQKNIKVSSVNFVKYYDQTPKHIVLSPEFICKRLGIDISDKDIIKILESLGFIVNPSEAFLDIQIPSYRATKDVGIKEDIVEEIGRVYGYNNIEPQAPKVKLDLPHKMLDTNDFIKIKQFLVYNEGLTEVNNYPFSNPEMEGLFYEGTEFAELENPLDVEQKILKTSLFHHLLRNTQQNLKFYDEFGIFEMEHVFHPKTEKIIDEPIFLSGIICKNKKDEAVFYARDVLLNLLKEFHIENIEIIPDSKKKFLHPYKSGRLVVNNQEIGYFGELHPEFIQIYDLKKNVSIFNLDILLVLKIKKDLIPFRKIPKIQTTNFDLAFVVDSHTYIKDLQYAIKDTEYQNIEITAIEPFDIYESETLGKGKKSVAFNIKVQPEEQSLTADEINDLISKIVKNCEIKGYMLRK